MEHEDYRRKLGQKNTDGSAENCPAVRPGGSAAHRSQQDVSRSLGQDLYVERQVKQRSKLQPKEPKAPEPDTLRPTGWRGLRQRGHA